MPNRAPRIRPIIERIAEKIALADSGCIEWTGSDNGYSYGTISATSSKGQYRIATHRWSYEYHVGPIPNGLHIDHLCRNRRCLNPDHLEPVTPKENQLRGFGVGGINAAKTECVNGHPLSGKNIRIEVRKDGTRRVCRQCRRDRERLRRASAKTQTRETR